MGALTDLWHSERGIIALVLLAGVTAALFTGNCTFEQWQSYSKWIFVTYATSKTVTGAVDLFKNGSGAKADAAAKATAPDVSADVKLDATIATK